MKFEFDLPQRFLHITTQMHEALYPPAQQIQHIKKAANTLLFLCVITCHLLKLKSIKLKSIKLKTTSPSNDLLSFSHALSSISYEYESTQALLQPTHHPE